MNSRLPLTLVGGLDTCDTWIYPAEVKRVESQQGILGCSKTQRGRLFCEVALNAADEAILALLHLDHLGVNPKVLARSEKHGWVSAVAKRSTPPRRFKPEGKKHGGPRSVWQRDRRRGRGYVASRDYLRRYCPRHFSHGPIDA